MLVTILLICLTVAFANDVAQSFRIRRMRRLLIGADLELAEARGRIEALRSMLSDAEAVNHTGSQIPTARTKC